MTKSRRRVTKWPGTLLLFLFLMAAPRCPAIAAVAPRYDGTITVVAQGPVKTLDPAQVSTPAEMDLAVALFEGLVREGPNGIEPVAATEWSHSPDERTWTFRLRPGMRFSDGAPVDAAAFIASWKRLNHSGQSNSLFGLGEGWATASDSLTIRIDFPVHVLAVLEMLSELRAMAVHQTSDGNLRGSGPFRFAGTTKDGGYLLVPRLDHHAGRPFAARVIVTPVAVAPPRLQDFDVLDFGSSHRSTRPGLVGLDRVAGLGYGALLRFDDAWFKPAAPADPR